MRDWSEFQNECYDSYFSRPFPLGPERDLDEIVGGLRGAVVFWFIEFSIQSLFCLCLMAWSLWVVLALLGYTMYSRSLHQRGIFSLNSDAHTKALTRVFLEILIFEYFGYLRLCFDKFFGTDSESPAWRRVKCNPEKLSAKNCFFGGHVTSAWLDGRKGFISRSG